MKTIPITFAVESERPVRVRRAGFLNSRYFWPVAIAWFALSLWAGWIAIQP